MPKIVLELDMSDELAEKASRKGLLSSDALVSLIEKETENKTRAESETREIPEDYDKMLLGIVPPEMIGSVTVVGDIIEPIDVEWDACK